MDESKKERKMVRVRICKLCKIKIPGDEKIWKRHIKGKRHRTNLSSNKQISDLSSSPISKKEQNLSLNKQISDPNPLPVSKKEQHSNQETFENVNDDEMIKIAIEMSLHEKKSQEKQKVDEIDLAIAMSLQDETQIENEGMDLAIAMSLQDAKLKELEEDDDLELQYILSQSIFQELVNESDLPDDEKDYIFDDSSEFDAEAF